MLSAPPLPRVTVRSAGHWSERSANSSGSRRPPGHAEATRSSGRPVRHSGRGGYARVVRDRSPDPLPATDSVSRAAARLVASDHQREAKPVTNARRTRPTPRPSPSSLPIPPHATGSSCSPASSASGETLPGDALGPHPPPGRPSRRAHRAAPDRLRRRHDDIRPDQCRRPEPRLGVHPSRPAARPGDDIAILLLTPGFHRRDGWVGVRVLCCPRRSSLGDRSSGVQGSR